MIAEEILFTSERLTIRRTANRQQCVLHWSGECDFRDPAQTLGPNLHSILPALGDRKLILDFCGLTFMNSSSVTPILAFVKAACGKGNMVHLIYNARLSWQRITASSMRALAHSLKLLTVELNGGEDTPR